MRPTMPRIILAAAAAAVLCALALPNELFMTGLWPLGFVAVAPLYLALVSVRAHGGAALAGAVFGACQHAMTSYWLFFYKDFALWTIGASTLAYAAIYAVAGMYGAFLLRGSRAGRPFVFAAAWVCLEFIKSIGFLGYPWGLLPYSMTSLPVMLQTADLFGVYGVSALLALSSALAGEAALPRAGSAEVRTGSALSGAVQRGAALIPSILILGLCLVMFLGYGTFRMRSPVPARGTLRVLMVQQNTDPWIAGEQAALESNVRLAREALERNARYGGEKPDLVLFSETSLRRPYREFKSWFAQNPASDPLVPLLGEFGVPLLTGAPEVLDWKTWDVSNSVVLIGPDGSFRDSYAKIHPVPFAEAIPFMEYAWFRNFLRDVVGLEGGWVMGDRFTLFNVEAPPGDVSFGAPICFEDAFALHCREFARRGADLLINLTNDSWSRTRSALVQHWAIARIRSIELRMPMIRSTNSGLSSVIDARGMGVAEIPVFTAGSLLADVPLQSGGPTLYLVAGEWFAILCLLLSAIRMIILIREDLRSRRRKA